MNATIDIGTMIVETPGTCGGRPRIAGHRITVRLIVGMYRRGESPEEIAANYESLSLAEIYAALAYYHANRDALDRMFKDEEVEENRLEMEWRQANPKHP